MGDDMLSAEVTIWTDAARAGLLQQVVDLMGAAVTPLAVGGPRSAGVSETAAKLGVDDYDDFRKMSVDRPGSYLLAGAWTEVGRDDLRSALSGGVNMLCLEPPAATLDALNALQSRNAERKGEAIAGRLTPTPAFLESHGWTRAADPREAIGQTQMISFTSLGAPDELSLFARLMDAWRSVLHFADLPVTIDASLTGPLSDAPDDPRSLTGHLLAHARLGDQCACMVQASDRLGQNQRMIRVGGEHGHIRVDERSYELFTRDGELLDSCPATESEPTLADLIASQWRRLLDRPDSAPPASTVEAQALACCLACQLSAKTGQPESPRTILHMHGW